LAAQQRFESVSPRQLTFEEGPEEFSTPLLSPEILSGLPPEDKMAAVSNLINQLTPEQQDALGRGLRLRTPSTRLRGFELGSSNPKTVEEESGEDMFEDLL